VIHGESEKKIETETYMKEDRIGRKILELWTMMIYVEDQLFYEDRDLGISIVKYVGGATDPSR